MAIMAGEAITEGGTAGMRGASQARRARRIPEAGNIPDAPRGPRGRAPRSRSRRAAAAYGNQARAVGRRAQITPGRSAHQGAILAEFIVAILIITIAPIATGGSGTGVSPYTARDLKRMAAIGVVYFGLALIPGDNGSKVAAWLGGLVLLALLLTAFNTGQLKSVIDIFAPGGTQPPGSTTPAPTA